MEIDTSGFFFSRLIQVIVNNLDFIVFMQYFSIIYCYINLPFLWKYFIFSNSEGFFPLYYNNYDLSKNYLEIVASWVADFWFGLPFAASVAWNS